MRIPFFDLFIVKKENEKVKAGSDPYNLDSRFSNHKFRVPLSSPLIFGRLSNHFTVIFVTFNSCTFFVKKILAISIIL